jgi:hypothetical protein
VQRQKGDVSTWMLLSFYDLQLETGALVKESAQFVWTFRQNRQGDKQSAKEERKEATNPGTKTIPMVPVSNVINDLHWKCTAT